MYEEFFSGARWEALEAEGARKQRPLWASTGVKNPDYDDTMYVVDLVVEDTVNTMPEKTLDAVADHGEVRGDRVRPFYDDAAAHMQALAEAGHRLRRRDRGAHQGGRRQVRGGLGRAADDPVRVARGRPRVSTGRQREAAGRPHHHGAWGRLAALADGYEPDLRGALGRRRGSSGRR